MDSSRRDPDALLEQIRQDESHAARGKLRIYFGASAGVGKTYAMLIAALKLHIEGLDVVAGIIETHGRAETAAQIGALEILPPRKIDYQGRALSEFDLDGALQRRPALILVDELAHSNVAGSRHPKRWQDVEELLEAGINVYSTLNVQHLDSLNDVVGGIAGIRVHETLPDTFFDQADEVVLVDTPADELIARLRAGKIYVAEQAERAGQNFFRKGNLFALRELALRRAADRVGGDVQAYRANHSISRVWKTEAALLCCIGPQDGSDHIIRSAARLAQQMATVWHAVYVETPALQRWDNARRERILQKIRLAQHLGAKTAVLSAQDIPAALVDYARQHNLSKFLVGRPNASRWWHGAGIGQCIAGLAPDLDLLEIGQAQNAAPPIPPSQAVKRHFSYPRLRYGWAAGICALTTLAVLPLRFELDQANIVMLFLLAVLGVAMRYGRGPAMMAAFFNVAVFDFFFVQPLLSFSVSDVQYLLTFGVMLAVGVIVGQLTAGLRFQARIASHREARSRALFEVARDLSSVLVVEQLVDVAEQAVAREFRAHAHIFVMDDSDTLQMPLSGSGEPTLDIGAASWVLSRNEPAGLGTNTLPGSRWLYLPLKAPMRARGVLAICPVQPRLLMVPEQREQLETFAVLTAIALERVHYVQVAQHATLQMESERLRNSLLSALSHDLRTPLAALYGMSEMLEAGSSGLSAQTLETARAIGQSVRRLNAMVDNLLDMARLQSGAIQLNRQWQPFEEVVGSALRSIETSLSSHVIVTDLAAGLPLVYIDAVLIERVLCNLLENAMKYTPAGSTVTLGATVRAQQFLVTVADNGPGLPAGREETLFQKFARGQQESTTPGVGLGLAICRAIIEAHSGRIWAETARAPDQEQGAGPQVGGAAGESGATAGNGARFCFSLPLGSPPDSPAGEEGAGDASPATVAAS
jgi:two-component system sensor histidine kinase KdpD